MNADVAAAEVEPGRMAQVLSVLSVVGFWLVPYSPLVAIGAIWTTRRATGWYRNLAVAGAALCMAYTVVLAFLMIRISLQVGR